MVGKKGKTFIGTSGFSYGHWQGVFYPEELPKNQWFVYYTGVFDTVELNNTFYHLPRESTVEKWEKTSPDGFTFAVKGSKFITHIKKLVDVGESLRLFESRAALLGDKLGVILFQFAPSFKKDIDLLENFLKLLSPQKRYTMEFRHKSWFSDDTYDILKKYNISLCASDTPKYPYCEVLTADFMYIRLHGHEVLYASDYSEEVLKEYGQKIKEWNEQGIDVYTYFDNDYYGYAVKNAKRLKELLGN